MVSLSLAIRSEACWILLVIRNVRQFSKYYEISIQYTKTTLKVGHYPLAVKITAVTLCSFSDSSNSFFCTVWCRDLRSGTCFAEATVLLIAPH